MWLYLILRASCILFTLNLTSGLQCSQSFIQNGNEGISNFDQNLFIDPFWCDMVSERNAIFDKASTSLPLIHRGFVLICERGTSLSEYSWLIEYVEKHQSFIDVSINVVGVPFYSSDTIENVIGRAVSKMAEYDPHYWAVAGHGDGGSVASILAKTMHPRVKMLGMLGAVPHSSIGDSLVGKNIYCIVVYGSFDAVIRPEVIISSLSRYPQGKILIELPIIHEDFARDLGKYSDFIDDFLAGFDLLAYPDVPEEGMVYMESNSKVHVSQGTDGTSKWISFTPIKKNIDAGIVFLQGAAVPSDAYAGFLQRLSSMGYFCVAIYAPGRNATLVINDVLKVMTYVSSTAFSGNWFVAGHSAGGIAASQWAYENLNLVPISGNSEKMAIKLRGVALLAGGALSDFKNTIEGRNLPFIQMFGSRDGGFAWNPDPKSHYVNELLLPYVPKESITVVELEGGTHFGWGYYGYQDSFQLGWMTPNYQQQIGAEALHRWITAIIHPFEVAMS